MSKREIPDDRFKEWVRPLQRREIRRAVRSERAGDRTRLEREGEIVDGEHLAVACMEASSWIERFGS